MIHNQAVMHKSQSSSSCLAGQFGNSKAFYDQVRSDFLQQSARYLRDSIVPGRAASLRAER